MSGTGLFANNMLVLTAQTLAHLDPRSVFAAPAAQRGR